MTFSVLVAEDSSYQRKVIADILLSHNEISHVNIARNGREAIEKIEKLNPDVLILDLVMPVVDGLTVFKFLSEHYPIPTIIFTSKDPATLDDSVQALLLGAFDFITKPSGLWSEEFPKLTDKLISSVLYAAKIKKTYEIRNDLIKKSIDLGSISNLEEKSVISVKVEKKILKPPKVLPTKIDSTVIVIGASTGGPKTLKSILREIPKDFPCPILVVQHLDPYFMVQLSKSMDNECEVEVKIPKDGEKIKPGIVYLSPGGKHMKVNKRNNQVFIKTFEGEPVNFCIPSVDVLFFSVAEIYKNQAMGILLTGLGEDGAAGLKAIKSEGGKTIAESEETCVVYGMPRAAAKLDAANLILPNYKVNEQMKIFARKFAKNI
ncbi:MAG: chemotaxis-specific protein-glutamate methyltransferase CheB [Promethearchaeota archaeon]|jgi:two-component system chemotaxis response regulator CheB